MSSSTPFIDLIGSKIFQVIGAKLTAHGLLLKTDTVVDVKLIAAPSSTKNKAGDRDPKIHLFKKGNQWRFGMKANTRADAESGLVHTVIGTAANVNDVTQGHALLHGEEKDVFADAGYQGASKRPDATDVDGRAYVLRHLGTANDHRFARVTGVRGQL